MMSIAKNKEQYNNLSVDEKLEYTELADLAFCVYIWLASDMNEDVRYNLACNANIPEVILQMLADDENVFVSCRASKTLNRILLETTKSNNVMYMPCLSQIVV